MSEPEIFLSPVMTLYIRSRINSAGMLNAPAPVLEVLRNTAIGIDLQIRDLAYSKAIHDLSGTYIRFIVRKKKYPVDSSDILIDIDTEAGSGITIINGSDGTLSINIDASDLNVAPSEYWYDLQIYADGVPTDKEDFDARQPLQKFVVLP